MKKIIFIVPYYGNWPPYFNIWIKTIKSNPYVDFLLMSDLKIDGIIPSNLKILSWTFEKLVNYIQEKFDFKICLDKPYKLCDFRPAYGYIFNELISDYEFWGHCDMDCVFGDLRKFLDAYLEKYDAIGSYGHLSLYRNCVNVNKCFKKEGSIYSYRDVFSNKEFYAFDEVSGIKRILLNQKLNCKFDIEYMADISTKHKSFQLLHLEVEGIKNYKKQIFLWDEGKLFQCYLENKTLKYKELLYLHYQKKIPIPDANVRNNFYILFNKILPRENFESDMYMLTYDQIYKNKIFKFMENVIWIIKKLIQIFGEEKKQRKIYNNKRFVSLEKIYKEDL